MMNAYEQKANTELTAWQKKMLRRPFLLNKLSKKLQTKITNWIPDKIHRVITTTIKQMIRGVLFGAKYTTADTLVNATLEEREEAVAKKIDWYRKTAAIEGGITGGILMGLADFPI